MPETDSAYTHELMLGDRFRFPGDTLGTVYGPVRTARSSYNLHWTWVYFSGGRSLDRHAFTRVEITARADKCSCGRFFEWCENECPWPGDLEELFMEF
ncbi:hypothetical protein [Streptomyces xinghaiensis]|uniref:hypothetical protein n=1 Tax=Streptomyces xinghaiensis TaxID=1038928 RepID=UPI0005934112|nr:hypothetical protein [Streptomyces xinghaiensis]MZE80927.1 hypothetical protein [Streptomyces sp. SID5475]